MWWRGYVADRQDQPFKSIGDILKTGPSHLRPPTSTKLRLIDSSATINGAAPTKDEIAYHHTIFCQTALPYREIKERVWERSNGHVQISVEAGRTFNTQENRWVNLPVPFGPKARIIMIHLDTEAVLKQSRRVDIQDSMTAFVKTLQGRSPTGPELRKFMGQSAAISTAMFRLFSATNPNSPQQVNVPIVSGFELWYPKNDCQRTLWPSFVELSEKYYETLIKHAVPLDHRAIAALQHNALALDIYKWLAQRLCRVNPKAPMFIPWPAVQLQFGQGYTRLRDFRAIFLKTLAMVMTQYPAGRVGGDQRGLTLHHSRPPIAPKIIAVGSFLST
jgi:hypothetical protein